MGSLQQQIQMCTYSTNENNDAENNKVAVLVAMHTKMIISLPLENTQICAVHTLDTATVIKADSKANTTPNVT